MERRIVASSRHLRHAVRHQLHYGGGRLRSVGVGRGVGGPLGESSNAWDL